MDVQEMLKNLREKNTFSAKRLSSGDLPVDRV